MTAKPDDAEVSGLTTNLSTLEMQSVVDENPADLKEYGLAEPRVVVYLQSRRAGARRSRSGRRHRRGATTTRSARNDKKVFLIASYLDSTFNRKTFDLRDKTAIRVDRDKLDASRSLRPNARCASPRPNSEWQLTAPTPGRADFSAVEGLVGRIAGLQMKAIAEAEPADLKKSAWTSRPRP